MSTRLPVGTAAIAGGEAGSSPTTLNSAFSVAVGLAVTLCMAHIFGLAAVL
jgi:hypothetical protein